MPRVAPFPCPLARAACLGAVAISAIFSVVPASAENKRSHAREAIDFVRDIRPLLSTNCYPCHGPDAKARKADLRLDRQADAFDKTRDHPLLVPGHPEKSELYRRISSDDPDVHMPPKSQKRQLTAAQISLIRVWIAQGAVWEDHWAFQPPRTPAVPQVHRRNWVRNPIDAFVLSRLEAAGISPSPEAARTTLLRRVTLDLTGLPPTIDEIDAFLNDDAPGAYEKVVDRLLASPAYGEKMAWGWLEAARYADSNGYQGDPERTMWPWRDWLVAALNANLPFDQFTVQMLAGDLLPGSTLQQQIATGFNRNHMINGEGGRIPEETRVENVFDRTETTATVWMGLTMTCCRCHDHKYDPITQREYYRLFAFFNNTSEDGRMRSPRGALPPTVNYLPPEDQRQLARLEEQIRNSSARIGRLERERLKPVNKPPVAGQPGHKDNNRPLPQNIAKLLRTPPPQRDAKALQTLVSYFRQRKPEYAQALEALRTAKTGIQQVRKRAVRVMVMDELKNPRKTSILTRGLYNKPTQKVQRGTPSILPPLPQTATPNRLSLARWLVSGKHPLTARVIVNRYWQGFFGTGLVRTAEDFGIQGEKPSHPALLDWLATEFVRSGWNVKHMHRLIVTSATYRQSSRMAHRERPYADADIPPAPSAVSNPQTTLRNPSSTDPANRLLWRFPRSRLPSWMLRDQALAVSGLATTALGGPPVKPYQPAGIWADATFGKKRYVQDHGKQLYRRSLYVFWRRIVGPTMFFDVSARQTCVVKPSRTNTPLHALITLNETAYVEAARLFAQRVIRTENTTRGRIELAFRLATARKPTPAERQILTRRLQQLTAQFRASPNNARQLLQVGEFPREASLDPVEHAAYTALCSLLLNLDEVLSKE